MANILLIDDDRDIVETATMFLQSKGHKITPAYSGQEGWEKIPVINPDLVILDVMMEEFNTGFQVARDIKIKYPNIPVILWSVVHRHMSAAWRFSAIDDQEWLPADSFVRKPSAPKDLVNEVERVLNER